MPNKQFSCKASLCLKIQLYTITVTRYHNTYDLDVFEFHVDELKCIYRWLRSHYAYVFVPTLHTLFEVDDFA